MATLSIGRASSCDIVVIDPTVSRQHAALTDGAAGGFLFVDRGSTSGSYVMADGTWQQVTEAEVHDADRLRLGDYETTVGELLGRAERSGAEPKMAMIERDPATGRLVVRAR